MGKIKLLSILGMIILLFTGCLSESDRAERVLQKHLKDRYGEEFVIFPMREREAPGRRWYESGIVYPESYIGTVKEEDSYYWGKGFVELGSMKAGDTYGGVLLNESANKFYGKKLEELFGKNYLAVLNVEGGYISTDFEEEMKDRKKLYKEEPKGRFLPLSGGIYIFGRVENDEDREWYRKQIYEFIQFMKETGTFEYVDLDISIMDERILTSNSEKLIEELKFNDKDMEAWRKRRREVMAKINREFEKMTLDEKLDKINSINKREYLKRSVGGLLYTKIYSSKYIESQGLDDEKKKEYEVINDIEFKWEVW